MRTLLRLRPADSVTVIFLIFLTALSLIYIKKIPDPLTLNFTFLLLLFLQILLIRRYGVFSRNRLMDITRNIIFPTVCVLLIFDTLEGLVHYINPNDIDPLLIKLDYLLFNGHPTVMLESFQVPILTDILQVAYSTYYFLPIVFGLILKLQKRDIEFDRVLFLILFCFYLSYIGYILMPALGPRYTINHLQSSELKGLLVAEPLKEFLNKLEGIKRDAFPSGHTGVALVVSGLAYRYHKVYFYITLPVITLLIFSTVYCRYHYVVDVIGGVALAVITFIIGERYYGYWEDTNNTGH